MQVKIKKENAQCPCDNKRKRKTGILDSGEERFLFCFFCLFYLHVSRVDVFFLLFFFFLIFFFSASEVCPFSIVAGAHDMLYHQTYHKTRRPSRPDKSSFFLFLFP